MKSCLCRVMIGSWCLQLSILTWNCVVQYTSFLIYLQVMPSNNNPCGCDPCLWIDIREEVMLHVEHKRRSGEIRNNVLRKFGYQKAVNIIHGVLGRGNRVELPTCVVDGIRNEYPDEDNVYMGYKDD